VDTLRTVLLVVFVIDSILLVLAILIQSGRGGGLAGALGGISSADSALGVRAASQIEKITGVFAAVFLAVALALAFIPHSKGVPEVPIGTREGVSGETTQPGKAQPATQPGKAQPTTPPAKAVATTPAAKKSGSEE